MKSLIVLAHPEEKSFCGALAQSATEALSMHGPVTLSDLYRMNWHAVSDRTNFTTISNGQYLKLQLEEKHAAANQGFAADVETEIKKIEDADLLLLVFPLWWFSMPAILKGWVDRVFAMGRAYDGGKVYDSGLFRGKRALLAITTGGPDTAYAPGGFNGDIHAILRPIHRGILQFTGFEVLAPEIVYGPVRLSDSDRESALSNWRSRLAQISDEKPFNVGTY